MYTSLVEKCLRCNSENNEQGSGACGINYLLTLIIHAPACTFQVQSVTHEIKDSTVLNALDYWRDTSHVVNSLDLITIMPYNPIIVRSQKTVSFFLIMFCLNLATIYIGKLFNTTTGGTSNWLVKYPYIIITLTATAPVYRLMPDRLKPLIDLRGIVTPLQAFRVILRATGKRVRRGLQPLCTPKGKSGTVSGDKVITQLHKHTVYRVYTHWIGLELGRQ